MYAMGKFGTYDVPLVSDGIKCRNDRNCWVMPLVMRFFFCLSVLLCLADDEDFLHTYRMQVVTLILVLLTIWVLHRCVLQRYWTTCALRVLPLPVCGRLPP